MTPVFFVDLDDTLFHTARIHAANGAVKELTQVTEAPGDRASYMDTKQLGVWKLLAAGAGVVPVTARTPSAFARVSLPGFTPNLGAVVSNGAIIYTQTGAVDPVWFARTTELSRRAEPALEAVLAAASARSDLRSLAHRHDGVLTSVTVKTEGHVDGDAEQMLRAFWAELATDPAFGEVWMHANKNNLGIVPKGISKREAVAYLMRTRSDFAGRPTIGCGDSTADLGFMALCDAVATPTSSQIFDRFLRSEAA